ncbi:FAD-dependent oxidoreductase [Nakamurella multipartita]|uniref:FAD-dependent pyridine nucleotide-disulfide oxidoreductase n=1 Tax=Nakamurella multipartita (strain ATCC 700099 / DSM 44233 / CIP 104796 / JCM 9543 / NBRC 105858 / Y-104) TaxID=479431 RepID=C8X7H3_NAKMY|nr:FAD-dependent oxidoreductase [Nakamurella multipartita]ACV78926.1 FAD-dependent pyridine nucleotide-disulfide oxidoreductase [Nakamurella multipartita DSM 44233]
MKIVVVGGVAAGMSCAARARRLDESAEIVVFERANHVSFANCGLPYHIGEVIKDRSRLLLQTPQSLHESLAIDVRIATEVLAIRPDRKSVTVRDLDSGREYEEPYEQLALCPGASPITPPLPGVDHPDIHVLRRIGDMDVIKAAVDGRSASGRPPITHGVVIGAGYIGLEMAENLHERGVQVVVVEMADQIMPPLDRELTTTMESYIRAHGVELRLGTQAAAFSRSPGGWLRVELTNGEFVQTDLVLLAAGVRPSTELAVAAGIDLGPRGGIKVDAHMRTSVPGIYAAGDAIEVEHLVLPGTWLIPLAGPANRQGRVAAENMCGRDTVFDPVQGTSIVKVFDMVAGGTGANQRQLDAAGVPYERVQIHPSGHAGYYPGTAKMQLKVLFEPVTGKLLGAGIVGFDGVDKRLDVLATALRGGMTVHDLEGLELAYAPPFGSAKDPINMAGFVAANLLKKDLRLWYPSEYPGATDGARIIDVRGPQEYAIWHLPGAENVPLPTLREAQQDWDRSRPIRLYCAVGFRSYLAYRALVQRGFTDVRTLSGGMTTFRSYHDVPSAESVDTIEPVVNYGEDRTGINAVRVTAAGPVAATGVLVDLDCTGLACPGPIMALQARMAELAPGDEVLAHVSDPGFRLDAPAWAAKNGHSMLELVPEGPGYAARFRKGGIGIVPGGPAARLKDKKSFVVFSGEFDRVLASFILANAAASMGDEVSMFFTFWGLNALRRLDPPTREKNALDRAFSAVLPSGPDSLPLSTMNMFGGGPALIKKIMKDHHVPSLPELIASAQQTGVRLIACTMTMDLLGIAHEDLIDGVELGGAAMFFGEANESNGAFFI